MEEVALTDGQYLQKAHVGTDIRMHQIHLVNGRQPSKDALRTVLGCLLRVLHSTGWVGKAFKRGAF